MICSLQKSPINEENDSTREWHNEGDGGGGALCAQKFTNLALNSPPSYFTLKSYLHFKLKPRHLNFKHVSSCGLMTMGHIYEESFLCASLFACNGF
jgi:hypothetical protein